MYNLKHNWIVSVLNPISGKEIENSIHSTIDDIAKHYKQINLNTWRNICMGRSKIYSKFIKVNKEERKCEEPEEKPKSFVLPKKRRLVNKDQIKKVDNVVESPVINNDKVILTFD